jgi:glutathione synthase
MRQDPPFDLAYISATHMLERVQPRTLVVNDPAHVRNAPEKVFVTLFPELMPPTVVTRDLAEIKAFRAEHGDIVMKPLYGKGGDAVFRLGAEDLNFGSLYVFANTSATLGSRVSRCGWRKRIILVDGEFAGAINRVPQPDDLRSNMVRGGVAEATELTWREREICQKLAQPLRERGLLFVGIDVIDGFLTEINVTSPTGIRAIKSLGGPDIAAMIWDKIERGSARAEPPAAGRALFEPATISSGALPLARGGWLQPRVSLRRHRHLGKFGRAAVSRTDGRADAAARTDSPRATAGTRR